LWRDERRCRSYLPQPHRRFRSKAHLLP
jgi:hypothetical protein